MGEPKKYVAVVEKVIRKGHHGPYAVARVEEIGLVTFSLDSPVWREETWPDPGTYVVLSKVTKKLAGWRAGSGRFYTPTDTKH